MDTKNGTKKMLFFLNFRLAVLGKTKKREKPKKPIFKSQPIFLCNLFCPYRKINLKSNRKKKSNLSLNYFVLRNGPRLK